MTRVVAIAMTLGLLAATPGAACQWLGTQLQCDLGGSRVVIGTQAEDEPSAVTSFRPFAFDGGYALFGDGTTPARRFRIDLQNIGADPSLCRRISDETYCY